MGPTNLEVRPRMSPASRIPGAMARSSSFPNISLSPACGVRIEGRNGDLRAVLAEQKEEMREFDDRVSHLLRRERARHAGQRQVRRDEARDEAWRGEAHDRMRRPVELLQPFRVTAKPCRP